MLLKDDLRTIVCVALYDIPPVTPVCHPLHFPTQLAEALDMVGSESA